MEFQHEYEYSELIRKNSPFTFLVITMIAAVIAALAAAFSAAFDLPVWAMFIGWVGVFTRGQSLKDSTVNFICVIVGVFAGMIAPVAIGYIVQVVGTFALPIVVFVVVMLVVSLRGVLWFDSVLVYF